ncbi:hypothetical protein [Tepidibacillus fermentans]|uniref:Uncharacterized protein n=1 Tax=Tepidibacillus fermentans TaxID=1281767 RepID=A0A4R3KG30_9BACI|nr:hypothetical protein [Tepidibacillus fermentans]TCS82125.1 hypothetical protein EDD72_11061 [Tepidibacillus fermentans]
MMKKIQRLKDFKTIGGELSKELVKYLEEEFFGLYEYLSNGEKVEDFILPSYQAMIILEKEEELNQLIQNSMELEFMEEDYLKEMVILRIGMRSWDDIQLFYYKK